VDFFRYVISTSTLVGKLYSSCFSCKLYSLHCLYVGRRKLTGWVLKTSWHPIRFYAKYVYFISSILNVIQRSSVARYACYYHYSLRAYLWFGQELSVDAWSFLLFIYFLAYFVNLVRWFYDLTCGLVFGVPGYRSRGPGSILGTSRFTEK
jgi:hypothetical protein